MKIFKISLIIIAVLMISSCKKDSPITDPEPKPNHGPTPYEIQIPFHFPTKLNIPADNPMTVEGVELGRYLFYDGRMSGRSHPDSLMACATCHIQANAFECGINHPKYTGGQTYGIPDATFPNGKPTPHFMLPMINLVFNNEGYLWNGFISNDNTNLGGIYGMPAEEPYNFRNIESLVWMGIVAQHEMNGSIEKTVQLIQSIDMYPPMFKKAFGTEEVNIDRISKAIAQFVRTLISANSKFDKYMRGEVILSDAERRGLVLFITEEGADCFHCHGGDGNLLFTTNLFYNNALDTVFDPNEKDRYFITKVSSDIGAYKATTLRNIEFTAPYMRDGRFATLMDVIEHYSTGLKKSPYVHPLMHKINDNGAQLSPIEKQDLLAFLKTLTDYDFIANPDFSNPLPGNPYFQN